MFETLRELLFSSRRRASTAAAKPGDTPAVVPPLNLSKEPGVTVHISTLHAGSHSRDPSAVSQVLDYVVGFVVIALVTIGGNRWMASHRTDTGADPQPTSGWVSPASGGASDSKGSLPGLKIPRALAQERAGQDSAHGQNTPPVPTHIEPAAYTDEAQKAGFHGTVAVIVSVDAQGVPEKMQPTEPIPYGLDRTVSQAIRQWRFRPASEHGVPIASQTVVYVPFR